MDRQQVLIITELLNVAWDKCPKGDYKQAFNLFKIVAESGVVEAQAHLGRMYFVDPMSFSFKCSELSRGIEMAVGFKIIFVLKIRAG